MTAVTLDTLALARKLAAAGLPPEQTDIIIWVAGLLLAQAVLIVTLVKLR